MTLPMVTITISITVSSDSIITQSGLMIQATTKTHLIHTRLQSIQIIHLISQVILNLKMVQQM